MAGIGFELRKALQSPDPRKKMHGGLSAAFSSFGAMLIGIVILLVLQYTAQLTGLEKAERDLFMTYITHCMFFSMLCTSVFSLAQSRYLSDAVYEERPERVMPAITGSLMLSLGTALPLMTVFLVLSHTQWLTSVLILMVTMVLCACWTLMNDLSLVRDYRQITLAFCFSLVVAAIAIFLMYRTGQVTVRKMLLVVLISYSAADIWLYAVLFRGFPQDSGTPFAFLGSLHASPALAAAGFFSMLSLLGHFFAAWHLAGKSMEGLFCLNLDYDFPAIAAYFTTIPAMIYFIVFFETDFCASYHRYLLALGQGGRTAELDQNRDSMLLSIRKGLRNFQAVQLISTFLSITAAAKYLDVMNIGMTEQMLNRFRMFCIAYALFATANILMLLQMYFMNERRASRSAVLYAACSIGFTIAEIMITRHASGLAFTAASCLYLLCNMFQLIHCLDHLEHHILCCIPDVQPHRPRVNLRSMERRLSVQPRSTRGAVMGTLAAGCAALVILSAVSLWRAADRQSRILTVHPAVSHEAMLSPWMGYAPWANSDEGEATESSLVYVELRWADWEPREGVYDIDFVEQEFRLETYRAQGRKVVFRFICDEPTPEEHLDIPEWLYEKTGDGDWYENEYGIGYSPNYENETLIQAHAKAISALGEAYGGDSFFAFVEIGSIGHWGEYHVNYEVGIRRMPFYDTRIRYIEPYLTAFPKAKFMTRYPLLETRKYGFGLYNDMTGDLVETEYWLEQMKGGIWEQTGLPEQADCQNSWKTSPIGGEFASSHPDRYFLSAELSSTLDLLRMSHQSFIGPKIIVNETEEDFSAASEAILKTLGYRYRVSEVTVDQTDAEKIRLRLTWCNDGSAPVYEDATLHLCIQDSSGDGMLWSQDMPIALRTLTDSSETLSTEAELPRELLDDDMTCQLNVSVSAGEEDLALPLALEAMTDDGWYPLTAFAVR